MFTQQAFSALSVSPAALVYTGPADISKIIAGEPFELVISAMVWPAVCTQLSAEANCSSKPQRLIQPL